MTRDIPLAGREIGKQHLPFIIADLSGNHNPSLDRALAMVESAAQAGVYGLKIQTYTADPMTLDLAEGEFFIADPNSLSCSPIDASGTLNRSVVAPVGAAEPQVDR